MRAIALAALLVGSAARADDVRLLVSIGSDIGDLNDAPLRWAAADARRVASLFVELGGVSSDRVYLLLDQPAQAVRDRLLEVGGRVRELVAAGHRPILIVYASGHAAQGELHLRGTRLPLDELRALARQMPAHLRVFLVDACESGTLARNKGGTRAPTYDVDLATLPLAGEVVISSSGPAEASQEWDTLGGSLFTHHLLAGLRGDADLLGDGKITLGEAYGYTYRRTVTNAAGGGQHPTFDFDLSGQGELVLTEPRTSRSAVVLPAEAEGRYIVSSQPRPDVVTEVDKRAGRTLRLAVPPGRYLVRKRMGNVTAVLDVDLGYGGETVIDDARLARRSFADVLLKGGFVEVAPWSLSLLGGVESATLQGSGPGPSGVIAARRTVDELWGQLSVSAGGRRFRGIGLTASEVDLAVGAEAGVRWLDFALIPMAGLSVEVRRVGQTYTRDGESDLQRIPGVGPLPARTAVGVAVGPVLGLEVPLPWFRRGFAVVEGRVLVRSLPAAGEAPINLGADARLGAGMRF